ncbi:MAG: GNAT family N-acetyltransferase [Alphaproteobacteria bacterium]|nr:GNAT family N-acetyltransferase [Alphaproteobacteria bacterium]
MSDNKNSKIEVSVVRNQEDWAKVIAIRAIVYIHEQQCPYDEEFDGNDFCGTQFIGTVDGEPAGTLRVRYFADCAKFERLGVRKEFRKGQVGLSIMRYAYDLCSKKGFKVIIGQTQSQVIPFMQRHFNAEVVGAEHHFSDHSCFPVEIPIKPANDTMGRHTDFMKLTRPEGEWDEPGILERSTVREPTNPGAD